MLNINKESEEFLDEWRLKGILEKYCKFLPIEIKFGTTEESVEDGVDKEGKPKYKSVKKDRIINNPSPLWTKSPNDLKDEDYLKFYKELYPYAEDPLFGRVGPELEQRGHKVQRRNELAVVQAVSRSPDGLRGASDPRKGGAVPSTTACGSRSISVRSSWAPGSASKPLAMT